MRSAFRRSMAVLCPLAFAAVISACAPAREPAYDAAIGHELAVLAHDSAALFAAMTPRGAGAYGTRRGAYRSLASRASAIALMASARSAGSGKIFSPLRASDPTHGLTPGQRAILPEYEDATVGYMVDFQRNLGQLEALDRAATGDEGPAYVRFSIALSSHEAEIAAYRAALTRWIAGQGARPLPPSAPPEPPVFVLDRTKLELRWTQMQDILRDALIYEREILNRNR